MPDFDAIQAFYTSYEKHLGTNKVTTGAFAYEANRTVSAIDDSAAQIIAAINAAGGGGAAQNTDAFGRLRVSNPVTLFDGKTLGDSAPQYWDDVEVSGGGTSSTHSINRASTTLAVSATTAGNRTRRTFRHFPYVPGKSQLILMTFVHGPTATGISRKVGLFTNNNGLFLDTAGTDVRFTRRTNTSGTPVDNSVSQANWNVDKMDGTGPSGITLDLTKSQILVIDYEWLGVGRVRLGFNIDGVTYWAHEFLNANNLDVVYMASPNLPLCYELANDGTGAAASFECICSTVISEGGEDPIGKSFGVSHSAISTGLTGDGATRYALIGLRIKSTDVEYAYLQPFNLSAMGTTKDDTFAWELVLDPIIAGTVTWTSQTGSAAETFLGESDNTVTGGTILSSGVTQSRAATVVPPTALTGPGIAIDGTPQILAIIIRPFSNMSAVGGLVWLER